METAPYAGGIARAGYGFVKQLGVLRASLPVFLYDHSARPETEALGEELGEQKS